MSDMNYIKKNYDELLAEVKKLSSSIGVAAPKIVAVTKSGSDEELLALFRAGAYAMGENRPQELKRRRDLLAERGIFPEIHEIGSLQTNKVKMIAEHVTLIHSLDRLSLAEEVNRQAEKLSRKIPVLVEINSAEEEQKGGILPGEAECFIRALQKFPGVSVSGLMTMGPVCDNPEDIRPYFRRTRELFDKLHSMGLLGDTPILSMGMSDSYRIAIEEGSTLIRVGRRLFIKD